MVQQHKGRIKILEDHEIDELYGLPRFYPDDRTYYFSLTQEERDISNSIEHWKTASYSFCRWATLKPKQCFSRLSSTRFTMTFGISCNNIFRFPRISNGLS